MLLGRNFVVSLSAALDIPSVPKWAKFIIADPAAAGLRRRGDGVVDGAFSTAAGADTTWVPMLAGAACWLVVFLLLPKPMWIYVFGHELTHAVWTWLFGGRVKKLKASSSRAGTW